MNHSRNVPVRPGSTPAVSSTPQPRSSRRTRHGAGSLPAKASASAAAGSQRIDVLPVGPGPGFSRRTVSWMGPWASAATA